MKKKLIILSLLSPLCTLLSLAQDTYQSAKLIENDLNGTARYVGMGGAMEALGADISTISTNPAGIAMFRRSQASVTGGLNFQANEQKSVSYAGTTVDFDGKKTRTSFDQVGFVWVTGNDDSNTFLNIGFNYHKSQNFCNILTAANSLDRSSQSKLTSLKYDYTKNWSLKDQEVLTNGVDANYAQIMAKTKDGLDYLEAYDYRYAQYQKGFIGEYDFNISANFNNKIYLGFTVGIHDVHYKSNSIYDENNEYDCATQSYEQVSITGTSTDFKFGLICRPMEFSPFRFGLYVHTPTFYKLRMDAQNDIEVSDAQNYANGSQDCYYDFRLNTPWRFGVSAGHTLGSNLALGLTYEFMSYGSLDNRELRSDYNNASDSDREMNSHTSNTLRGVHTVKVGAEFRPFPSVAVRAGYNYISPMYKKDGYRDGTVYSPGTAYATSTDYTNWFETHRFTAGIGYQIDKNFQLDLAYQYQTRSGEFAPFMSYYDDQDSYYDNIGTPTKVTNKRHQLMATLTYKF